MARRPVAWVAAIVLLVEAVGIVLVNAALATLVDGQHMSLAGLASSAMSAGAWIAGGVAAVFLAVCAVLLALTAIRDRAPGRVSRVVLIVCAVVHGVLGAVTFSLVGWWATVFMLVVLGLLVWVLQGYGKAGGAGPRGAASAEPTVPGAVPPGITPTA